MNNLMTTRYQIFETLIIWNQVFIKLIVHKQIFKFTLTKFDFKTTYQVNTQLSGRVMTRGEIFCHATLVNLSLATYDNVNKACDTNDKAHVYV
jgi:hypothetical protein